MLPVDLLKSDLLTALHSNPLVVVQAPPGSGKTTRIPLWLQGPVIVLEPRRLAARWAARFVAGQLGQAVGEEVGYQVRFDNQAGRRITYATEGILTRRLLDDPGLSGVQAVVLDEFHERHLHADVALALLRRRVDLKLVLMSATLDAEDLATRLGGAPVLKCEGRLYPVETTYLDQAGPLEEQVTRALERAIRENRQGHVLVFLPGAAEIRRCRELAGQRFPAFRVLPLHGELSPEEQDEAVQPGEQRKIILSTNVAETSVTIEGVSAVIDSGLARVAVGRSLRLERIARSSADQRAGRAGRTGPGRCYRLYSERDYAGRPAQLEPEIRRLELSQVVLELERMGVVPEELPWLEPPPAESLRTARELLTRLGALHQGRITELGKRIAAYPVHPRLGRLIEACGDYRLAAMLSERQDRLDEPARVRGPSDPLHMLPRANVQKVARQLEQIGGPRKPPSENEQLRALLLAFPDRVGRLRGGEVVLAFGQSARVAESSVVGGVDLVVVVELDERFEPGGKKLVARSLSAIQSDWLYEHFFDELQEVSEHSLVDGRVEERRMVRYGQLVLEESRRAAPPSGAASEVLYRALRRRELPEEVHNQLARLATVARALPEEGLELPSQEAIDRALRRLCEGRTRLEDVPLFALVGELGLPQNRLDQLAPNWVSLPGRGRVKIHYETDRAPWLASRLQDFCGLKQGFTVARGRVPVVLHLLAPNQRPVQLTTDLAGFWERTYPSVRRELSRRYPRHPWPEDPTVPLPPREARGRR